MSDFLDLQGAKDLNTDAIHIGAVANSVDPETGAQIHTHVNRVGGTDYTLKGFWNAIGPVVMPWTSVVGGTLTQPNQAFLYPSDGNYYSWGGAFPKVVAPGTDPVASGSGYVPRTDVVLRPQVREALRRSYAAAGYTLVAGSFEVGGTLTNANDVLLHDASGKAYTGPAVVVAAGTNPTAGGFTEVSFAFSKFNAADYGLKETNSGAQNCAALQALSAAVMASGGGKVYFPSGVYEVGAQHLAGATGKGYAYTYEKMFDVSGLTKPLSLSFDGVVFKFASNLRYGAFDPVSGNAITTTTPYYVADNKAETGFVVNIDNCKMVDISGSLEIDGRDSTRIIGGLWGDGGRQLIEYGIRIVNSYMVRMDGAFYLHNLCLDGLYLANRTDDNCFCHVTGVVSLANGRQGVSVSGGKKIDFHSCTFGLTGTGAVSSPPAAGVDLEPEAYPLRGVVFNSCNFPRSVGACVLADDFNTRGVVFNDCEFENNLSSTLYIKVSNTKLNRCTIRGKIECSQPGLNTSQSNYGLSNTNAYPEFVNCDFYNLMADGSNAFGYPRLMTSMISKLVGCRMFVNLSNDNLAIWADTSIVDGLRIIVTGTVTETTSALAYFRNHNGLKDIYVENKTTTVSGSDPANTARVELYGVNSLSTHNLFISKSVDGHENILWNNSSRGAGARAGFFMDNRIATQALEATDVVPASKRLSLAKRGYEAVGLYVPQSITSASAIPTSGYFTRGDIVLNCDPSPSAPFGWICTTTGTAGSTAVFKIIATIGA